MPYLLALTAANAAIAGYGVYTNARTNKLIREIRAKGNRSLESGYRQSQGITARGVNKIDVDWKRSYKISPGDNRMRNSLDCEYTINNQPRRMVLQQLKGEEMDLKNWLKDLIKQPEMAGVARRLKAVVSSSIDDLFAEIPELDLPKCPLCSETLEELTKFCPHCGGNLNEQPQ
jgi:hypothetical protein